VHAGLLPAMLTRIDRAASDINQVSQVTGQLLAPHEEQLQQAEGMPGWGRRSAQDAIAETGAGMTRFRTPAHLVSWAGRSPLDQQSAGKNTRRAKVKKGNRYLGGVLGETAIPAGRTQNPRRRPLPAARPPPRQGQSPGRPRQHPAEGLPHAAVRPRPALPGPRRRLLRPPQHPPAGPQPHPAPRKPRIPSHPHAAAQPHRMPGGRLTRPTSRRCQPVTERPGLTLLPAGPNPPATPSS